MNPEPINPRSAQGTEGRGSRHGQVSQMCNRLRGEPLPAVHFFSPAVPREALCTGPHSPGQKNISAGPSLGGSLVI